MTVVQDSQSDGSKGTKTIRRSTDQDQQCQTTPPKIDQMAKDPHFDQDNEDQDQNASSGEKVTPAGDNLVQTTPSSQLAKNLEKI